MLTMDRAYAKEILNSIGMAQAHTDRDRVQIVLSYRCLRLTVVYWVKEAGEQELLASRIARCLPADMPATMKLFTTGQGSAAAVL